MNGKMKEVYPGEVAMVTKGAEDYVRLSFMYIYQVYWKHSDCSGTIQSCHISSSGSSPDSQDVHCEFCRLWVYKDVVHAPETGG